MRDFENERPAEPAFTRTVDPWADLSLLIAEYRSLTPKQRVQLVIERLAARGETVDDFIERLLALDDEES